MKIDSYCSESQYAAHVWPVQRAFDSGERGVAYYAPRLAAEAERSGLAHLPAYPPQGDDPILVASAQDHRAARRAGRPVVYVEHGSGQSYDGTGWRHPSYSGGPEHEGTVLFVCPNEAVADRWRAAYPGVPAVAVGCPKLDARHAAEPRRFKRTLDGATVAISFHSDVGLCAETRSAWRHYRPHLPAVIGELNAAGARVVGHAHPRLFHRIADEWALCGAEPVADFDEILDRADCYCVDNSSTLYEFASMDRPVVALNAPWYRRDVEHGLRFWSHIPGVMVDHPWELPSAVVEALADPPEVRDNRHRVVSDVYAACDGHAADRAVEAIRSVLATYHATNA